MDDNRLERDIEALFEVEPAPDFRARLRQRIAQEPPLGSATPAWRFAWTFAAGTTFVAIVAIGILMLRVGTPQPPPTALAARSIEHVGYIAPHVVVASSHLQQRVSRHERREVSRSRVEFGTNVIVDASEAAAWRRLFADMTTGRMELALVADAAEPTAPLPEGFVLPPVTIEPLTPDIREQGVRP